MLIPSHDMDAYGVVTSLSRRVNANSQLVKGLNATRSKLIKKGEC